MSRTGWLAIMLVAGVATLLLITSPAREAVGAKPGAKTAVAKANKSGNNAADKNGKNSVKDAAKPAASLPASEVDRLLALENEGRDVKETAAVVDDLAFLRRVTVDLVGRIPNSAEIAEFKSLPAETRRSQTIDRLLQDERFADRWAVFYYDMLRVRTQADGGYQLAAFIQNAVKERMPYDVMCRQLIAANGKAGRTPEVGFILGDQADPMAMAGVTSQVFLGIRIACAQCHDHPFDVWTREQFYGLAAYFGKTRRIESQLTRAVYTTEMDATVILWPPEDKAKNGETRTPVTPAFPFEMEANEAAEHIVRLAKLRKAKADAAAQPEEVTVDDLLSDADTKARTTASGNKPESFDVAKEAKQEAAALKVHEDLYQTSLLRKELSDYITSPRNRFFSQNLVNRVWADLLGRGFVEPIDDFSQENQPSHPKTLDYLTNEFVASGFDLRTVIRLIANSDAYQRGRLLGLDEPARQAAEDAFASARMRRMLSESLFDSIVQAGHLFDVKYPEGANMKTIRNLVRIPIEDEAEKLVNISQANKKADAMRMAGMQKMGGGGSGYDLESAIEVDFASVLAASGEEPAVDEMSVMSEEEIEAMEMTNEAAMRKRYIERWVEVEVDDNPKFASAMRMASPADPSHFLRVFGQSSRDQLGEHRDDAASMRQALMMLNGRLTHEASRVGDFEPVHPLIEGKKADPAKAIRLVYQEILTREPSADELAEGQAMLAAAESPREGLADLRWILFNCHEFRFLP